MGLESILDKKTIIMLGVLAIVIVAGSLVYYISSWDTAKAEGPVEYNYDRGDERYSLPSSEGGDIKAKDGYKFYVLIVAVKNVSGHDQYVSYDNFEMRHRFDTEEYYPIDYKYSYTEGVVKNRGTMYMALAYEVPDWWIGHTFSPDFSKGATYVDNMFIPPDYKVTEFNEKYNVFS